MRGENLGLCITQFNRSSHPEGRYLNLLRLRRGARSIILCVASVSHRNARSVGARRHRLWMRDVDNQNRTRRLATMAQMEPASVAEHAGAFVATLTDSDGRVRNAAWETMNQLWRRGTTRGGRVSWSSVRRSAETFACTRTAATP